MPVREQGGARADEACSQVGDGGSGSRRGGCEVVASLQARLKAEVTIFVLE